MELSERLEQIVKKLRPTFSREATFQWFVILLWGIVLSTQPPAITSYLNALGLGEEYYAQAGDGIKVSKEGRKMPGVKRLSR